MKRLFRRQNWRLARLAATWRAPRGAQSKQRIGLKARGALPQAGYGSPRATRGLHPSGLRELLVFNPEQLAALPAGTCVRIAAGVGRLKRLQIQECARRLGIVIVNPVRK